MEYEGFRTAGPRGWPALDTHRGDPSPEEDGWATAGSRLSSPPKVHSRPGIERSFTAGVRDRSGILG